MAFQDDLATHIDRIRSRMPHVQGEEATKQALVVPLLQVLGYDVFDPREVRPEYVADFAVKKAGQFEKIDYTICVGGLPVIFVECKALGAALEDHSGQLSRYFNSTPSVRVAWITDGVHLRVFTDLLEANIMDDSPGSASTWIGQQTRRDRPHCAGRWAPSDISAVADEMVYYSRAFVVRQLREWTDSFARFSPARFRRSGE